MLKRGILAAALTALLGTGTIAQAARGHRVDQTVTLGILRQSAGYPNPGSSAVYAGTVRSKLGRGAIVETIEMTGHPGPTVFTFRGTSTAFYSHGTTRSAFIGTGGVRPGGGFTLDGHGRYTGGSLYHHLRREYLFTGTAPPLPQTSRCAVPTGSRVVASDAQVVVVLDQPSYPIQEYRYCTYADPSRGFQLLVRNDDSNYLGGQATFSTVDGVAFSYLLYHSTTGSDSPQCNSEGAPSESSTVYALDTATGSTQTFPQNDPSIRVGSVDGGAITSALLSPPGVAAWIFTDIPCSGLNGPGPKYEALKTFSFRTGTVTTLDTGDPNEAYNSPPSLGNLQLYQCAAGCPANTVTLAWTHDGTWRYAQSG